MTEDTLNGLRSEMRRKLAPLGINADDLDVQVLGNAKKVFDACSVMDERRKDTYINDSSVERESGVGRRTLHDNRTYAAIVAWFRDRSVRERDEEMEALRQERDRYKAAYEDTNASLMSEMAYKTKLALLQKDLDDAKRQFETERKAKYQAVARNTELEHQVVDLQQALRAMQPPMDVRTAS